MSSPNDKNDELSFFDKLDSLTSNQEDLFKVYQYTQLKIMNPSNSKQLSQLRGDDWYLPRIEVTTTTKEDEQQSDTNNNKSKSDDEDKNNSIIDYSFNETGLSLKLCGCVIVSSIHLASLFLRISFLVLGWLLLWLSLPRELLEPGGAIFDLLSTFVVCFLAGGILGRIFGIPPLLFIFLMGILWGNVGEYAGYLVRGISLDIRTFISRAALTVILLRSGLAMSWKTIQPAAVNIITMSIFPLLIEVIVHGFVAKALLDYGDSEIWPFVQSMTASPSASAVVGATVLDMRARGYGIRRGPGVLLVPSVILDFTLGIWGINFIVELLFSTKSAALSDGELAWEVIQGPLQMVLGVVCGIILGFVWYYGVLNTLFAESKAGSIHPPRKLDRSDQEEKEESKTDESNDQSVGLVLTRVCWHSLFVLCLMGGCCVFGGYEGGFAGGGCLACAFLAATVQHLATREDSYQEEETATKDAKEMEPKSTTEPVASLSSDDNRENTAKTTTTENTKKKELIPGSPLHHKLLKNFLSDQLARVWNWVFMPALFAFSGSAIKTSTMFEAEFAGRAIACLFIGAIARIIICTICTWTFPMTRSERVISMIASAGRGSAQVALGSYALTRVQQQDGGGTADELKYGRQVYDAAELGVIILGTISIVLISRVGPCFWLTDDDYEEKEKEEKQEAEENKEKES